jgi:hypothetical protein
VTDAGLKELKELKLTHLHLYVTQVGDAGVKELTGLPLQFLQLEGTKITDTALKDLKEMKTLSDLTVTDTAVTNEGVTALRKARPNMKVYH